MKNCSQKDRSPATRRGNVSLLVGASLLVAGLATSASASPVNLLTNGDFEAGITGFSTGLAYDASLGLGTYALATNPNPINGNFASFHNHTTGSGLMMAVNGATTETLAWSETVSVATGQDYVFSTWLASMFGSSLGVLNLVINGNTVDTFTAPGGTGSWQNHTYTWNSGAATSAILQLVQTSTGYSGNDYALDDLSFFGEAPNVSAVPLPPAGFALASGIFALLAFNRRKKTR